MIQRIQTVYLLLAFVAGVLCLSLPTGYFMAEEIGRVGVMYNLLFRFDPQFVVEGMEGSSMAPVSLFVILVIASTLTFLNIFLFRKRALQMRVCTFAIILNVAWYVLYAFFAHYLGDGLEATFRPSWSAALPFACIVLLYLAFRGTMKDEMLVRSLDRLR